MPDPVIDPKGPGKIPVGDDEYYSANAKLAYYKQVLNNVLRSKNPTGFDNLRNAYAQAVRTDYNSIPSVVEQFDFKDALSPQEIKGVLKDDYDDYIKTITSIRDRGFADGKVKKLFGENEMNQDVSSLMFGKRFSTMPLVLSISRTNVGGDGNKQTTEDIFSYDHNKKAVNKFVVKR